METVEDDAEIVAVGLGDDLPGGRPILDVAAPGQRLVAEPQTVLAPEIGEVGEIRGDAVDVGRRLLRDRRAEAQQGRAQFAGELELPLGSVEIAPALRLGRALEIAERLQGDDVEARVGAGERRASRATPE